MNYLNAKCCVCICGGLFCLFGSAVDKKNENELFEHYVLGVYMKGPVEKGRK